MREKIYLTSSLNNKSPQEIIADNVLAIVKAAKVPLTLEQLHYLGIDVQKSIFIKNDQLIHNWVCSRNAINFPCNQAFSIKNHQITFDELIEKSIKECINRFLKKSPSL